jgi:NADH:ubiquinone oxidoreductase subunit 6 (subunit J)
MTTFLSLLLNFIGGIPLVIIYVCKINHGPHTAGLMTLIPFIVMMLDVMSEAKEGRYMSKIFPALAVTMILLNLSVYFAEFILNTLLDEHFFESFSGRGISFTAPTAICLLFTYLVYPALRLGMSIGCFKLFRSKIFPRLTGEVNMNKVE